MATAAKERKKRQARLPGMERDGNPKIEQAAHDYWDAMTARCKKSHEEAETKDALLTVMLQEGVERYETADGFIVTLKDLKQVKMKRLKDEEPDLEK